MRVGSSADAAGQRAQEASLGLLGWNRRYIRACGLVLGITYLGTKFCARTWCLFVCLIHMYVRRLSIVLLRSFALEGHAAAGSMSRIDRSDWPAANITEWRAVRIYAHFRVICLPNLQSRQSDR